MERARSPRLSLDLLRGFGAAARHLSFTRAAQELFVTQGAISREVRTLEEQLGQPLFRRINRRLELTAAGQELLQAVDKGLALIDTATTRIAGGKRTLGVTTTVALASTWLVPRLRRFAALHPYIDLRVLASNDSIDLEREHLDLAIRYVHRGATPPSNDKLFDYWQFPVCSPSLAADEQRPLRAPADVAQHVLLDFETVLYGKPWYDWAQWLAAKDLPRLKGAGWLRFSHYDQVIAAARTGSGVAVGKWPHLASALREGTLLAPMGSAGEAQVGAFYVEIAPGAATETVRLFADWVRAEAQHDAEARTYPSQESAPHE